MKLPNPWKQVCTRGVMAYYEPKNMLGDLWVAVIEEYQKQPNQRTNGDNDKFFFSFTFGGERLFVAANEIGGLTIMLPEEY